MLFNTMIRVESYHLLHEHSLLGCAITGVAWLSSVRAVRRMVNSDKRTQSSSLFMSARRAVIEI